MTVINASLREGNVLAVLKNILACLVLKKPGQELTDMNNYYPICNLLFLEKVEQMVRLQLQRALEETDYLNTRQSGFRPGHGKETALVSLTGMKEP